MKKVGGPKLACIKREVLHNVGLSKSSLTKFFPFTGKFMNHPFLQKLKKSSPTPLFVKRFLLCFFFNLSHWFFHSRYWSFCLIYLLKTSFSSNVDHPKSKIYPLIISANHIFNRNCKKVTSKSACKNPCQC